MEEHKIDVLHENFRIMRIFFFWPNKTKKDNYFKLKALLSLPFWGISTYGNVYHFGYNIYHGKKLEIPEIIEDLYVIVSLITINYVVILFVVKSNDIKLLSKKLGDFSRFGMPENAKNTNKKVEMYVYIYFLYCTIGPILYSIASITILSNNSTCKQRLIKNGSHNICGIAFNAWIPFGVGVGWGKYIVLLIQCASIASLCAAGSCTVTIIWASCELVAIRINHFCEKIKVVFANGTNDEKKNRLRHCIRYHQYIIELVENLNYCFGLMLFVHMTISAVIFSLIGYKFILEKRIIDMFYPVGFLGLIFIVCYGGQRILDKSIYISNEIYNCGWQSEDLSLQRDIKIMLMRSQRYLTIKSAGFGIMCFATFQFVIRSSYSYLTLLHNTSNKQ